MANREHTRRFSHLGVIGGLGPGPTAQFYLNIVQRYVIQTGTYPSILIDSVPLTVEIEQGFIEGQPAPHIQDQMKQLLRQSVDRLYLAGCDLLVLPCNTLHGLIDPILQGRLPLLHLVETTLNHAEAMGYLHIGVLATESTRRLKIYDRHRANAATQIVYPDPEDQTRLNRLIRELILNPAAEEAPEMLAAIIHNMASQVDCVLLACTDFAGTTGRINTPIPVIESLSCLIDACLDSMLQKSEVSS